LTPQTVVIATDVFSVGIPVRLALIGRTNKFLLRLGGEWWWEDSVEKGRTFVPLKEFWQKLKPTWRTVLAKLNYHWIMHRAQKIAVTSEMLGDVLKTVDPKATSKITIVENVSPANCQSDNREVTGPHTPLRLLYVGRFARVKNVPFLARVIKRLHEGGLAVQCTFAGDGPDFATTQQILAGVPGIKFLGKVEQGKIPELLQESDLLVLPSLSDICPNVVLEALACGVPCLITKEHGLGVGLKGMLEPDPQNFVDWKTKIAELASAEAYLSLRKQVEMPRLKIDVQLKNFLLD